MAASLKPENTTVPLAPPELQLRGSWIKLVLLAIAIGALVTIVYLSPLRQYLGDLRDLSQRIRSFGSLAPLVLTAGVAVLVGIGFPRLVFCVLAGMALGFWSGLLWAQIGTLLGNYVLFIFVRELGRDWAKHVLAGRVKLHQMVTQRGVVGVMLARQLPVPGLLINLTFALLPIKKRDFLLGTVVGQLPQAIPCTLIGAGLLQASLGKSIGLIGLAVAVAIVAWLGVVYAFRRTSDGAESRPE